MPPLKRRVVGTVLIFVFLVILSGAVFIPFFFESSSILYKFGFDKTLLRSGKVIGLIAACLLLLQILLSARLKLLDRIFALNNLMNTHRVSGVTIACLILFHPVLIFLPEDMSTIPVSLRYWPEFVGGFLFLLIIGMAVTGNWRISLKIPFDTWRTLHKLTAFIVVASLFTHVLFVSETFEAGIPRVIVFSTIGLYVILFLWISLRPIRIRKYRFVLSCVAPAGKDAYALRLRPDNGNIPNYFPGQFGFITLKSSHVSHEEHPFTIASSPTRSDYLEFVIRTTGDWTRSIRHLETDDRCFVDGPYGHFSHFRCVEKKEIIMISGGIGITPMLSMLRYMADTGDQRQVTLIWSNKTRDHIIFREEFKKLEARMPGLRIIHVLTREPEHTDEKSRLDQSGLEQLLVHCSRDAGVFVCGPPRMMKDVSKALVGIGYPRRSVNTERFSL